MDSTFDHPIIHTHYTDIFNSEFGHGILHSIRFDSNEPQEHTDIEQFCVGYAHIFDR